MPWLEDFRKEAERTDRFKDHANHLELLAAGLMGEAGSVIAEFKKIKREERAYPHYRQRITEELGDSLWYLVRLADLCCPSVLKESLFDCATSTQPPLAVVLELGIAVGELVSAVSALRQATSGNVQDKLIRVAQVLALVALVEDVRVEDAATFDKEKIASRWPEKPNYVPLWDEGMPLWEILPRELVVEFLEVPNSKPAQVVLRCNGLNFGDRLTDNIEGTDGYRFHDILHFAHAVYLGWSPVIRALLKCKRKSDPKKDEAQDGARAVIIEEAVAAMVFNRAKRLKMFEGLEDVDFDLLKAVAQAVEGFEVEKATYWQWNKAIVEGYKMFRLLRDKRGGTVRLDLVNHRMDYIPPKTGG